MRLAYRLASLTLVLLLLAAPVVVYDDANAAEVSNRSILMQNSQVSAVTQHQVRFDFITGASTGSVVIEYCSNTPLFIVACTPPAGMNTSAVTFISESGETGFSIHGNTNANRIVLTRPAAVVTPQPSSYLLGNITNPSTLGTFYARISTYASTDGTGARIDEGGVAMSTAAPVSVGAYVPPVLLFCLGNTIPGSNFNCSTASGDGIDFGEFSRNFTSFGTIQMVAATNGGTGYTITVTGTTMTSGNNTITPIAPRGPSLTNTSQFGFNMRDNSLPNVGSNITGPGTGTVEPDYNVPNQYYFQSNDVVARSSLPSNLNKYTVSYVVNVNESQPPGVYSTTLTYVALAGF